MTHPPPESDSAGESQPDSTELISRKARLAGGGLLVVCLTCVLFSAPAVEQLLLGWLYFPLQALSQITVHWPSVILGIVCTVGFVFGLHVTLKWFVSTTQSAATAARRSWSFRSTLVVAAAAWLLFGAGTAMVATTHQTIWLITGRVRPNATETATEQAPGGILSNARRAANRSGRKGNLKMFGLGFHNFHDVMGSFPAGGTMTADGTLLHGWAVRLGPFLDLQNGEFDFSVPWNQPPNDRLYRSALPIFLNPEIPRVFDADGFALSHLAANLRVFAVVTVDAATGEPLPDTAARRLRFQDIKDGSSNTILIGEVRANFKPWGHPANIRDPSVGINRSPHGFGAPGGDGAHFLLGDGSVKFITSNIDPEVLRRLASPADGQRVGEF
jgi:hypothetical protein